MYVYFIPQSGFNDILCLIENALRYCVQYNRILLLDTYNSSYMVNFSNYFIINRENIIYDINEINKICNDEVSVYPECLSKKISKVKWTDFVCTPTGFYYDNIKLDCLPHENRTEKIIVYSACGGGYGYNMFRSLTILPSVISICKNRYAKLRTPYLCIHIRNTDYKCDYEQLFYNNKELIESYSSVYIATDSKEALEFFKSKHLNVYNFTTFGQSKPLHYDISIDSHTRMIDLISDIYIITMSDKILSNSQGGFISLVRICNSNNNERQFLD